MELEINAGYVITDRLVVGNSEFVIGESQTAPSQFVTWKRSLGEKDFYWGHYVGDRLTAMEDLCKRVLDEAGYQRKQQPEVVPDKRAGKNTKSHER